MTATREVRTRSVSTEDVLAEVAASPVAERGGRLLAELLETLRRQGRSRVGRGEIKERLTQAGLDWDDLASANSGNPCEVLVSGPRRTSDVALVDAWLARGLAARLAGTPLEVRRKTLDDLVPLADHLRLLTPFDPYRMLGSFVDKDTVLMAFDALTDAIVRDARALAAGRSSRLRAVITQRIESLVSVLPPTLCRPFGERIRGCGGDPAVPLLLDAAQGTLPEKVVQPSATPPPAEEESVEGRCEHGHGRTWAGLILAVSGLSLLRGVVRLALRGLLGLRRAATVRSTAEGLVVAERTWLLGQVVRDSTSAVGQGGLIVIRVDRRTSLFVILAGLLGGTLGAGAGLFVFLDGIRGEYAALMGLGLVLIGAGVALDMAALWTAERLGTRASVTLGTADGRWYRIVGVDPSRALRFAASAKGLLGRD